MVRPRLVVSLFTKAQEYQALQGEEARTTGERHGLECGGPRLVSTKAPAATIVVPSGGGPAVELLMRAFRREQAPPPTVVVPPWSFPKVEELVRA